MNPTLPSAEPPAWLAERHFIPLPSDPAELTIEHVRNAFTGDWSALKDVRKARKEAAAQPTVSMSDSLLLK